MKVSKMNAAGVIAEIGQLGQPHIPPARILIAEDDETALRVMEAVLKK